MNRFSFSALLLFTISSLFTVANAQVVTETARSFKIEYANTKDASFLYDSLALPLDFGDVVTGRKHQYKLFDDASQSLRIYCDAPEYFRKRCFIEIFKNPNTDLVAIEHDTKQSNIEIYEPADVDRLNLALNTQATDHGGFLFKVVNTDDLNTSISCLEKKDDTTWKKCVVRFFHSSLP